MASKMQLLEFETPAVKKFSALKNFVMKHTSNPVSKAETLIAIDTSYPHQESDDSFVLLLPLAVKDFYLYLVPYIDMKTELTEYCIRISKIDDLVMADQMYNDLPVFMFDGSKKRNDAKMRKGLRYVLFL